MVTELPHTQDMTASSSTVAMLHRRLIDEMEPSAAARIHLELGNIAIQDGKFEQAITHFKEALWWDPHLDAARSSLLALGEWVDKKAASHRGGGVLRFLVGQFRRGNRAA